ncbi:putative HTH-type transcriptional regulator [Abditibacteriota bacterium]|nr:putative HTH-type transcriptional regulator [Abditibacteriota bacterium]
MNLADYPTGFVTLVFTDIQGSTKLTSILNAREPGHYEEKLRDPHRVQLAALVQQHRGYEIQRAGDGHLWVFHTPQEAIKCMVEFQRNLQTNPIITTQDGKPFVTKVRIGIHCATGVVPVSSTDAEGKKWVEYPGEATNYASRVTGIADGGQILISEVVRQDKGAQPELANHRCHPWRHRFLKDFSNTTQTVHEVLYYADQQPREPGLRYFVGFYQHERNRYIERRAKEKEVLAHFTGKGPSKRRERLVVIHAEGGMGKTRLAVACAAQMAGAFTDGVHFVNLANIPDISVRSEVVLVEAIAEALGWGGQNINAEGLVSNLFARQLLLVLDNYESVACEAANRLVSRLAIDTLGAYVLVTGRQGAQVDDLQNPISLDGGMALPEAEKLFKDRARQAGKNTWRDDEAAPLAEILRLVSVEPESESESGPIPLAVELSAAWTGANRTLWQIADSLRETPLDDEGGVLQPAPFAVRADDDITDQRHRSLKRSFDWSFKQLATLPNGTHLQELFVRCGLFGDSFTPEIVAAISGYQTAATDTDLTALQRVSLLRSREDQVAHIFRFYQHRFTRAYARFKLAEHPRASDFNNKFIAHYTSLVSHCEDLNLSTNRAALDESWRNILAAARWAIETQEYFSLFSLTDVLTPFFQLRGLWSEWESLYLLLLSAIQTLNLRELEGAALNNLGNVYQAQGRVSEAEKAFQDSLAICREFGDRLGEGKTLTNLGIVYQKQGRFAEAGEVYGDSLIIKREFGDRLGEGKTLTNLGIVYRVQGRFAEAKNAFQNSLTICREFGDRITEGAVLNNLGNVYQAQGHLAEAENAFQDSLTIKREFRDRLGEGQTLNNLGGVYQAQGRFAEAENAFQDSLAIKREFRDHLGEGTTLNNLGGVYQAQGRFAEAENAFQNSLTICREFGNRITEGQTLDSIALLHEVQNNLAEALDFAQQAVQALENTEAIAALEKARVTLARIKQKLDGNSNS